MKIEQLKEDYHRFRRWQQEGPRYVNKHPGTVLLIVTWLISRHTSKKCDINTE